MQDVLSITRSVFDAFNRRVFDYMVSLTSDQFEWADLPTGRKFSGKEGLQQWCQLWIGAFSDASVEIINHFGAGDWVCTEYVGRGKQTGPLSLGKMQVPPSNRTVELLLCNVTQVRGGKMVSGRVYYDLMTMMRQLGIEQARIAA